LSDPEENLEFLLNPEQISKFIEMLKARIDAGEAQLTQLKEHQTQVEETLNDLRSKLENLQNYHKFLDLKGYAYTKQQADSHFKEIQEAEKTRMTEETIPIDPDAFNSAFRATITPP